MTNNAPVMFIGHGSPMFALRPGRAGNLLNEFGQHFTDVKAILVTSPHWITNGLKITSGSSLETIHDYYGFPQSLYQLDYTAPGDHEIATTIQQHLNSVGFDVKPEPKRGRDHGTWVPMLHLLPDMKIPVLQLSLDHSLDAEGLIKLGEALKPLRAQGIAMVASGNLTHNLHEIQPESAEPVEYVERVEKWVRQCVTDRAFQQLSNPHNYCSDFQRLTQQLSIMSLS